MESIGVTLTSSLTYESGKRIKGKEGSGELPRGIIYLFFLSSPRDLFSLPLMENSFFYTLLYFLSITRKALGFKAMFIKPNEWWHKFF